MRSSLRLALYLTVLCMLIGVGLPTLGHGMVAHAQTSTPPTSNERPLIFIRSFRTEPAVVQADQTFRLFLELHNVGSAGATNIIISLASENFVPQGSSSVKTLNGLTVDEHGWVWQDLRGNPDLKGGTYAMAISISYQGDDGVPYASNETVGVNVAAAPPTPTPTAQPKPGIPQLVIEQVATDPVTIIAGEPFTLTFAVRNTGTGAARRTLVTVSSENKNFAPTVGSNVVSVGDIGFNKRQTVSLHLVADTDTTPGLHTLQLGLDFINWGDEKYSSQQVIAVTVGGVSVGKPSTPQALPIIESYVSEPLRPSPGQPLTLRLNIRNVGTSDARRLNITFGTASTGGSSAVTVFAPLGTGNVRVVPVLGVNELTTVEMQFIVSGSASAGTYVVPIEFSYDGPTDKTLERTEQITLLVSVAPQLRVSFYRPVGQPMPDTPIELPIEIINQGRNTVGITSVELGPVEGLMFENASVYIGSLDSGQSGTLDAQATAAQGGEYNIEIIIKYIDDFNQNQVYTATLPLSVLNMGEPGDGSGGSDGGKGANGGEPPVTRVQRPFWQRLFLGLFGLGSG
ncbi:MAG: CARDB domain-containing protein [Anaerolineae bacterium]